MIAGRSGQRRCVATPAAIRMARARLLEIESVSAVTASSDSQEAGQGRRPQ